MKGLSRKKFSPCRPQFLAASLHVPGTIQAKSRRLGTGRSTYLEATPANRHSLVDRFCFCFGLAVCIVVYVVTCKDVPTMVLSATPVC